MFWEVNRGGALILPGARGLLFISRRSQRCGAANQIRAERLRNFPDELALENLRKRKYAAAVSRDAPDRITKADEEYPFPSPSARKNLHSPSVCVPGLSIVIGWPALGDVRNRSIGQFVSAMKRAGSGGSQRKRQTVRRRSRSRKNSRR